MKIAFFGLNEQWKKDYYLKNLPHHDLKFYDECLTDNFSEKLDFDIISIFIGCHATPKILSNFPNLKFIAIRSTGYDNVDLRYTQQNNIQVSNVPAYGSHTVAEFTFALLLALSRNIYQAIKRVREEKQFNHTNLRGFDLNKKTIGVIGTGKIGANVIKIAKGFNMEVIAYDKFPDQNLANNLNFKYTNLNELLANSDIITLHTPYNKDTHHLLNEHNISLIKKGAYLINTSRGGVIDTEAMFKAVNNDNLSGIALDVMEEQGEIEQSTVDLTRYGVSPEKIAEGKIILTPHTAFFTKEAEDNIQQTTIDNIEKFIAGNPQNLVTNSDH